MSEWRTIPGFPGYLISDEGEVVSPFGTMLTRTGRHKDCYRIRKRDGTAREVFIWKLLDAAKKRGRVVPDPAGRETPADEVAAAEPDEEPAPVEQRLPVGCVPIPGLSPYCIDRAGHVWNSATKKSLSWLARTPGSASPRVSLRREYHPVNRLLDLTFGPGAAEDAGLPPPRRYTKREKAGDDSAMDANEFSKMLRPSRRCHDCGRPTDDYRCPDCRRAWRLKNNVSRLETEV